jgi:hypothetical protein
MERVSYTAEQMYLLATQNTEDFNPYYEKIREAAESGLFLITFEYVSAALSKDLKANGFDVTYDAWDGIYIVSWK